MGQKVAHGVVLRLHSLDLFRRKQLQVLGRIKFLPRGDGLGLLFNYRKGP